MGVGAAIDLPLAQHIARDGGAQSAAQVALRHAKVALNRGGLGVGGVGSVSLPFMSGGESLVKVGSETIASDQFYESFFDLVKRYLLALE